MGGREARHYWEDVGLMMLVGGLLLAPLAWFLDLQISYAMIKWACEHDARGVLLLPPLGSLALIAGASWMSWACWTKLRTDARPSGGRMEDRSYFLAISGLALNAVFGLLVLLGLVSRMLLSPCE